MCCADLTARLDTERNDDTMTSVNRILGIFMPLAVLTLVLAVACESSEPVANQPEQAATASPHATAEHHEHPTLDITVSSFSYDPRSVEVTAGTTVTWHNSDQIFHSVTSGTPIAPDGRIDGGMSGAGTSFAHTFTTPGSYAYYCSRHTFMRAEIIVR
jgi:plastocyanin